MATYDAANASPEVNAARRELASSYAEVTPAGSALDAKDAYDAWNEGRYGAAVGSGAWAAAGLVPGAKQVIGGGKFAVKAAETALNGFRKMLSEAGKLRASEKAHHIVEKGDKAADASRKILEKYGIGIHSIDNGIGLSAHAGRHSNEYSRAVLNRIQNLRSAAAIKRELEKIAKELRKYDNAGKKVNDWAKDQLKR